MPVALEEIPDTLAANADAIIDSMLPHLQSDLMTWTRFGLRGRGVDGVEAGDLLVLLGSTASMRPLTAHQRPDDPVVAAPTPTPKRKSRAPRRPPPTLRGEPQETHSLLRGMGLRIRPAEGEAHCQPVEHPVTVRHRVLEDALETGALTQAQAFMPLKRAGVALDAALWTDQVLAAEEQIEWHPRVAPALCAGYLGQLRSQGWQGIAFADGTVLVFPAYSLRGLSKERLWRELCGA